ncbi:MAG: transposase, partial [Planctomycetes bacterium]|nr:transposase [Planctomycetota bacterium]
MTSQRRQHAPDLKAKLAIAALTQDQSMSQLALESGVHVNLIARWRDELKSNAHKLFNIHATQPRTQSAITSEERPTAASEFLSNLQFADTHILFDA